MGAFSDKQATSAPFISRGDDMSDAGLTPLGVLELMKNGAELYRDIGDQVQLRFSDGRILEVPPEHFHTLRGAHRIAAVSVCDRLLSIDRMIASIVGVRSASKQHHPRPSRE